ncbi:MAG: hypothetical protein ACI88H_001692 [Cocleimonas sp.]|jgi:hypothetical protein
MIESRYKIEYVLPDDDEQKSSPFKVIWYLLLIPLVLVVVAAITYDFSFKDLSRDSLVLVEKAKVHLLNLGDPQKPKITENKTNVLARTPVTQKIVPDVIEKTDNTKTLTNSITAKPKIDKYKFTISELSAKQELQLKNIQKQIKENSALTSNLNKLSEQLVLEQVKNEALNSQLADQEKDRLELEEQLNKMLESSMDNITNNVVDNNISLEGISIQNNKQKTPVLEAKVSEDEKNTTPLLTTKITAAPEKENNSDKLQQVEQSETDKIIQTMTSIAADTIKKPTNKISDTKELKNPEIEVSQPEKTLAIIKTEKQVIVDTTKNKKQSTNSSSTLKTNEVVNVEEDKEDNKSNTKKPDEKLTIKENIEADNQEVKKPASAVDAIIAAMESSKSNNTNTSKNPTEIQQKVDPKLEQ